MDSPPPNPPVEPIDWARALTEHDRWLRTIVAARVGERQAVDEVMQEVALAVVQGRALPTDPAKVAPWLYRVAVMQSLLYRRKVGRRRKLHDRVAHEANTDGEASADPLSWLLADERRQLVRRALARLAPRDAEILSLKYTENWSYRELAEKLGTSESAVEARLHRARQRMRQILAEMEIVES